MTKPRLAGLTLRANFGWTFAGNVVHAASLWCILAALAKIGSAEAVGKLVLGLAVAAPVTAIVMLQLRLVQATDAGGEYTFADYFGTRIAMTVLGLLVIAGIALLGREERETAWVVFLVGLSKSIECISEVVRGLFQRYERMNISGGSLMIKGPATMCVFTVLLWSTGHLITALVGMIVVGVFVLALYDLPCAGRLLKRGSDEDPLSSRLAPSFRPAIVWRLVRRALPLGVGAFLLALQTSVPRYVLSASHGDAALGYFGAMAYFLAAGTMLVSALGQSASPRLALYYMNDLSSYRRLFGKLRVLGLGMGLLFIGGVVVLGKPALTILYRPDYAQYHFEFVLLSITGAITFLTFFYGYGLVATRVFTIQLAAGIVCSIAAVGISFGLVPQYGIRGAAIATIATNAIALGVYAAGHRHLLSRRRGAAVC